MFSERSSFPQSSAIYADEKDVFGVLMSAMQELVTTRPDDPIEMLIDYFTRKSRPLLRVEVIGPPYSGRRTLAYKLAQVFDLPFIEFERLVDSADPQLRVAVLAYRKRQEPLPPELAFSLLRPKIFSVECVERGWVMCGFPETRAQDELFRRQGIWPQKIIVLSVKYDQVVDRCASFRYDPLGKRSYSVRHHMPTDSEVIKRLTKNETCQSGEAGAHSMRKFAYEAMLILKCASSLGHEDPACVALDGGQPVEAVFIQALQFLSVRPVQRRPYMHRILFLGRPGTGKKIAANKLADINKLYHVSSGSLILQAATDPEHRHFNEINTCFSRYKTISDDIIGEMVSEALQDSELQGFVLRGFPQTRNQAELLDRYGFRPSKVFFFNCSEAVAQDRLLLREKFLYKRALKLKNIYGATEKVGNTGFKDDKDQVVLIQRQNKVFVENEADLRDFYKDVSYEIDARLSEQDASKQIKYFLTHPRPLKPQNQEILINNKMKKANLPQTT